MGLARLPELAALDRGAAGIRIPPGVTVPFTPRVRALIDTAPLRRLTRVSQLGLVAAVYPGATHSRFEHSLGVYRTAIEFLGRLRHEPAFVALVDEDDAAAFLVAALVHDVGHWPYCHPIEDMELAGVPKHESLVAKLLADGEAATVIAEHWRLDPARIGGLVTGSAIDDAGRLLHSLLSGPVDVDKIDYLGRDSLHAGVPYGRHFDRERLLASLCLDATGTTLAITEKGRTAAEMLVFARYVMFSEVYWHHAVRSATAMLQRAVWIVREAVVKERLETMDDATFVRWLTSAAAHTPAAALVDGLFGDRRRLFKRVATFDAAHHPAVHGAIGGRPYADTVAIAGRLATRLSAALGRDVSPDDLLVDAPPREREVEFRLDVRERPAPGSADARWRPLAEVSPVVRSLAHEQFDDIVKRVRLFAPPHLAAAIASYSDLERMLLDAGDPR